MKPIVLALAGSETIAGRLAAELAVPAAKIEFRRFPDGESYVRLPHRITGRVAILVCSLDRPDDKLLPLLFAAATARDRGASSVGLVAPYLAYLRQDKAFKPGEGITSSYFARMVSQWVDWVVTVDPHLHRTTSLSELYDVPAVTVPAAPSVSAWIGRHVRDPVIIGPDHESDQWVATIARHIVAPYVVLKKSRHSDRRVRITAPDLSRWRGHTPVIMDDIISTARTMATTVSRLRKAALSKPVCIGVHGVFAGDAYATLRSAGAGKIVTTNTIRHRTNRIDISQPLAAAIRDLVGMARMERSGKPGAQTERRGRLPRVAS